MSDDTVLKLSQPSTFSDPLTEVLRSGARSLLARAVEAEVAAFLDGHSEARTEEGRRRVVRHGHLPGREMMTGIGPVAVRAPRDRDRTGLGADRIRFSSTLLPPYARRSKSLEVLIPVLHLRDFVTIKSDRRQSCGDPDCASAAISDGVLATERSLEAKQKQALAHDAYAAGGRNWRDVMEMVGAKHPQDPRHLARVHAARNGLRWPLRSTR